MVERPSTFADEVELIDIFRVIWKWKYFIFVGTLVCSVIAYTLSILTPKVYRIDMVLRPGILKIAEGGKNTYIDSPENIKALIETGTFNKQVIDNVANVYSNDLPRSLNFKVDIPKRANTLKVSYETTNVDQGISILDSLSKLMLGKYNELVHYYQIGYETEIKLRQTEIDSQKAAVASSKRIIKHLQKRIDQLRSEVALINDNTNSLIKERNKFLVKNNKNDILSSILYTNTIQQNLSLANTYRNQINSYISDKENQKVTLEQTQNDIRKLLEEIKDFEFKKNSIQNIQILQPPISSPFPIKPKKKLNVMLATMVGFFTMVFLAFLLEYLAKHKSIKTET